MADMNPDHETLAEQARAIKGAIEEAEALVETKHQERVQHMKDMRDADCSWASIGRAFGVTPQAAMYATGASVRTPKPRRRQDSTEG